VFVIEAAHPCIAAPASPWPPKARNDAKTIAKHSKDPPPNATRKRHASRDRAGSCAIVTISSRHRDVVSEVYQGVGQVARDVSEVAGEPSGHDHCEHRQDEIGDLHFLRAERLGQSGTLLSSSGNVHAEAI
jgi:hypothetical protein